MAENQTIESRYESKYGGGFVTPAQYIAEMVCERMAKKDKKDLPYKFWNDDSWKMTFKSQLLAVLGLLKIGYSPIVIIAALKTCPNLYSLRVKWFDKYLKAENEKYKRIEASKTVLNTVSVNEQPRPAFKDKESIRDKLRDL